MTRFALYLSGLIAIALALGCTTTQAKKSADRETYAVIGEKTPAVPNMDTRFTIDPQPTDELLEGLPTADPHEDFMGDLQPTQQARVVSLEKALDLAVKQNRTYQNEKEVVFLSALQLTLDRHEWTPIFSGAGEVRYARTTRDEVVVTDQARLAQEAPNLVRQIGQLAGTPAALLNRYAQLVDVATAAAGVDEPELRVIDERSTPGAFRIGVSKLMAGGGQIAIDLTSNFLRFITGDPRATASSALIAQLQQPLLRGAGRRVAQETLTQSERNVLYDLRDFTLFRKDFAVGIAEQYYRVLQDRDTVLNNYLGYTALVQDAERMQALYDVGQTTLTELGLTQQSVLDRRAGWIESIQQYRQALDEFKIQLGLSTDASMMLDPAELEHLREVGLRHPDVTAEEAVEVALVTRLDLYTARDEVDDAERKLYVAANALKPGLDVVLRSSLASLDDNRWAEFDYERAQLSAGLALDPDLDRKGERNQYRSTLIALERAARQRELAEDQVKLDVRQDWRDLEAARRTFEIRQQGVALNERRVEEQQLRAQYGLATARDTVEAQNDLTSARNALTAALVDHNISRLRFWRDMGILYIKENGQWEEVTDDYPEPGTGDAGTGAPGTGGAPETGTASAGDSGEPIPEAPAAS